MYKNNVLRGTLFFFVLARSDYPGQQLAGINVVVVSLLIDYFFFVILFFFLTFLAVSRRRDNRSILSLLSAPWLITCVLKVRIVVAESVKGKCCGHCSRVALCAFGTDAVQVFAVGLRSRKSGSDLSPIVCRAAQISLCCRVCVTIANYK